MLARFLPLAVDAMAAICRPNKKRTVAKMMGPLRAVEIKYLDTSRAAAQVSGSGVVDPYLCNLTQGVGSSFRIGRLVNAVSLEIIGNASIPVTTDTAQTWDAIRIMVVLDKQCNGALFGVTDLLVAGDEKSHTNPVNEHRFEILKEQIFSINGPVALNDGGGAGNALKLGESGQWFRYKIPLDCVLEYGANAGAVSDLRSNNIAVLAITRNGRGVIEYIARLRYTDA